jgi:RHS repeat-associated protein
VLDDAAKTVWRARIDPYGTAHVDIGADFHQPLRWPGHYLDAETGLHDNRFRTYSPELGRYLQCDPSGTEGGINLYAYTDNPLRAVDLRGQEESCPPGTEDCPFEKEAGKDKETPRKGAKRGPKTDPDAPHNATIRAEADALEAQGNTILAGGGRSKERLIPTPGGEKGGRRPDILYETPEGELRGRNVGKVDAQGNAVPREQAAMRDLNGPGGLPTDFVPYNKK